MTLGYQHLDCGREMSDFYENTPYVSQVRNATPMVINLRWDNTIDPSTAVVEFYNYYSMLPNQQARTFTTRGTFGIYPQTSPDMQSPLAAQVVVPHLAARFRIRFGPYVTNFVPVEHNAMYFYKNGRINQFYDF